VTVGLSIDEFLRRLMALQDGGRLAAGRQDYRANRSRPRPELTRGTNVPTGNSVKKHSDSGCGLLAPEANIIINNQ
jgi:hypothetical protein